ncbi:MAG: ABC transporter ATP-binding protein [Solidesulfovibrio sp.]|uniref:ABC transporter ATP-binding protein n=1 Tax=Solidesulfovibrio sp. TaxID=2910990 RepID=UPI00315951D1
MNDILITRGLNKAFGNTKVVSNVNITAKQGEAVVLLGPSGSGKSTLLGLLAGLERPDSGEILLDGDAMARLSEDQLSLLRRQKVGFVFQAFHLIPTLSALENVAFPLYPTDVPIKEQRHRATTLLEQVGLAHRQDHLPAKLSGGERQRVAIARALVNHPKLIFCDEPSGNLDFKTGSDILDMLFALNRDQGVSLFIVTHDQSLVERAHKVFHMHDGEVVTQ